jgi:hypothetical protein
MAYFVRIGAIPSNKSGVGARGVHIYRRGSTVYSVWGSVEVRPGRRFYWAHTTQHKIFRCASPAAAIRKRQILIANRSTEDGYTRLPTAVRILRHAKSASSSRRV